MELEEKNIKLRCIWCNRNLTSDTFKNFNYENPLLNNKSYFVCSDEHYKKTVNFLDLSRNYYKVSYLGLKIGLIIYPLLVIFLKKFFSIITMIMCFDFGIGLFLFPFTTPNLIKKIGLEKAIIIAKIISVISILIGFSLLNKILQ